MKTATAVALISGAMITGSLASSAAAEEWTTISGSPSVSYLADLSSIATVGDDTTIRVARVPLPLQPGDYSHKVNEYAIRCAANQSRILVEVEYGPDGAELDRYPETDATWDTPLPDSFGALIKRIACDNARGQGASAESLKAYIDGGAG